MVDIAHLKRVKLLIAVLLVFALPSKTLIQVQNVIKYVKNTPLIRIELYWKCEIFRDSKDVGLKPKNSFGVF